MFKDKVVIVTGAAAGLGLAAARRFCTARARVALVDIDEVAVRDAAVKLAESGGEAMAVQCDVADAGSVERMVAAVTERFGRLDIAYNNAGIQGKVTKTADVEAADFCRIISVNLAGVFNCMKYELRQMIKQGQGGCIVNCSSQSGLVGSAGTSVYTAAKHGVIGLTKCAALEYIGQGIRINAVCPGAVRTQLVEKAVCSVPEYEKELLRNIPVGRMAEPEELADVVMWLASPANSFMVGQAVVADGGYTIK